MLRKVLCTGVFPVCAALVGCAPSGLTNEQQERITRWLTCTDCVAGEVDSVVALGADAVPALARALRGPDPARRENVRRQLVATYGRAAEYAASHPADSLAMSLHDYVNHFVGNYEAVYQTRAARALALIGTEAAEEALEAALAGADSGVVTYRADVLQEIRAAYQHATTTPAIGGVRIPR